METPKQFQGDLFRLVEALKNPIDFSIVGVNKAEAIIKERVFNRGSANDNRRIRTSYKGKGKGFNAYSRSWGKKRQQTGRQTSYVDLENKGDLRKSIVKGTSKNEVVLGFVNEEQAKIGRGHEKTYRGKKDTIFALNEKEADESFDEVQKAFDKLIDKIWSQTF